VDRAPRKRRSSLEVERDKLELARTRLERIVAERQLERLYDAAKNDDRRPRRGSGASGNAVMGNAGARLRDTARYLDENDGNAISVLDDLVDNVVGTGVTIEPQVVDGNGELLEKTNAALRDAWLAWWERPDITGTLPGSEVERLAVRSWLRDGEVFVHHVDNPRAPHFSDLPYSLELLEADYCPFDTIRADSQTSNTIVHGVEKDAWNRPLAYWIYLKHPGDSGLVGLGGSSDVKRVPAEAMQHIAFRRRLHQTRGVTVLHGVINTLYDVKEAWESERVAMRVAAAMTGFIRKGLDWQTTSAVAQQVADSDIGARTMEMTPGMIYEAMGDEVGTIGHDRPNNQFDPFTQALMRQVAGGTGTRASAIMNRYDGTYSAQRQELVEGTVSYRRLFAYLLGQFYIPVWRRFVRTAVLSGQVRIEPQADRSSLGQADFRPPALPWIDPLKEMQAYRTAVESGFRSRHQVIRDLGGDPMEVDRQLAEDDFYAMAAEPAPPDAAEEEEAAEEADET
jgi:lambda family phage portal protein